MKQSVFFGKMFHAYSWRQGFTLLELAFVLLVSGFIIGAIWVAAHHTWYNYQITRSEQQITKITQNIREYYMNAQYIQVFSGTDITVSLDQLNLFPLEMRRNPVGGAGGPIDNSINNSVAGGSFHVLGISCHSGKPGGSPPPAACFRVQMQGLSEGQCSRLLQAVPVNDADLGIVKVGTQNMASNTTTVTSPVNADTAETWCNNAGATNEVDWDFKLHN